MEYLNPVLENYKEDSFSHNFMELFRLGLEFADNDPRLHRLGEDFSAKQRSFVHEFYDKYNPDTTDVNVQLLTHAQKKGELCEGVNIPITAMFLSALVRQVSIIMMVNFNAHQERDAILHELHAFIERAVLKNN